MVRPNHCLNVKFSIGKAVLARESSHKIQKAQRIIESWIPSATRLFVGNILKSYFTERNLVLFTNKYKEAQTYLVQPNQTTKGFVPRMSICCNTSSTKDIMTVRFIYSSQSLMIRRRRHSAHGNGIHQNVRMTSRCDFARHEHLCDKNNSSCMLMF